MSFINNVLPSGDLNRKLMVILVVVDAGLLLTIWNVYGFGHYGIGLFMLIPLFIGMLPAILYGKGREISGKQAMQLAVISLALFILGLIVFAVEGLVCITMAVPIALFFGCLGSVLGWKLSRKSSKQSFGVVLLLLVFIPLTAFISSPSEEQALIECRTSVEVKADIKTVWKNVVGFPELPEPTERIFKIGVGYPISSEIERNGVGGIRRSKFSTGTSLESITAWDEPNLLAFDVINNPAPMKELNFWTVDAPHLHNYFEAKSGQLKLTKLENGNVRIEGTTWYKHGLYPKAYWSLLSDYIINSMQMRVLNHIKECAEKEVAR
ncbi:hypothetical protein ACFLR1_04765 [Bacteroidota bacterium]